MACNSSFALCGVCMSSLCDARVLPCLHSLCEKCVDQLAVTATHGEIQCPICRWTCRLPPGGAAALPTDLTVSVTGFEGSPKCVSCVDDETRKKPSIWCKKCRLAFCDTHTPTHILSATTSREVHGVVPLSLASADGRDGLAHPADYDPLCAQHNEPLKFHCGSCDVLICGDCTAIGDHQGHKLVRYIKDVVQERKRKVGQKVDMLENDVVKATERALTNVDNVAAELSRRTDQVRADIRQAEKKAVDMVKAHVRQMIQDVDDLEQSRHKILDDQRDELKTLLDAARNATRFSGRVMKLETTRGKTLFSLLEALEARTTGLLSTHINEEAQGHSRLMFETPSDTDLAFKTKESVGRVIPCEASAKHSELKGGTTHTLNKCGQIAVTIRAKDNKGEYLRTGGDTISTRWRGADRTPPTVSISDNGDGSYALSSVCSSVGTYDLEVYVNGEKMANDLKVACITDFKFDMNERHSSISISEDRRKAFLKKSLGSWVSILGNTAMRHGEYTWNWKIGSASSSHNVGVAGKPLSSYEDDYHQLAYCWYSDATAYWHDGVQCPVNNFKFSADDMLQLHLDCNRHILQITNLSTGENSTMTNLPDKEYFPYATLYRNGSSVEFVE